MKHPSWSTVSYGLRTEAQPAMRDQEDWLTGHPGQPENGTPTRYTALYESRARLGRAA